MSSKHTNVWQALAAVQQGMDGIRPKSRGAKGNLYIDLDLLLSKARPLCAAHGLVIAHDTTTADDLLFVRSGVVLAATGEQAWVEVPIGPQNPGVTREEAAAGVIHWAPHAIASAFSYGRRIGLSALFAVSQRDDDATDAQAAIMAEGTPVRQPVSQAGSQPEEEATAPKAAPVVDDQQARADAMLTLVHCGKAMALLPDDSPDKPSKANIGHLAVMVGEFIGLEDGVAADLKATDTATLQAAALAWTEEADRANDVPL